MTKKTNKKMFKGEALCRPIHIVTYGAYITHKGHKIYLLRIFLRRRLAARRRDSIETESKKANKNTKTCFL